MPFYRKYCYSELLKYFKSYHEIHMRRNFSWYFPLTYNTFFSYIFKETVKIHWFSHKYWICLFVVFLTYCFESVKEIIKHQFQSKTTILDTKFLLPQHSKNLNAYQHQGSAYCYEVDHDLDVNCLSSGNLSQ